MNPVYSYSTICWARDIKPKPSQSGARFGSRDACTVTLVISHQVSDVFYHVVALSACVAICASDVIVGMFGHGFLIASDSLTKHPSGPAIQPNETISDFDSNRGRGIFENTIQNHNALLIIDVYHLYILRGNLMSSHSPWHFFPW